MAITGRLPLLLLLGVVPVVLRPEASTVRLWLLLVALLVVADVLLAPSVTSLTVTRRPVGTVRMGDDAESVLLTENTGRRRLRGVVRDAWQPTAGSSGNRHRIALAPGDRVLLRTGLTPRRRGDLHALGVTARLRGPLGLAARQKTLAVPGTVR